MVRNFNTGAQGQQGSNMDWQRSPQANNSQTNNFPQVNMFLQPQANNSPQVNMFSPPTNVLQPNNIFQGWNNNSQTVFRGSKNVLLPTNFAQGNSFSQPHANYIPQRFPNTGSYFGQQGISSLARGSTGQQQVPNNTFGNPPSSGFHVPNSNTNRTSIRYKDEEKPKPKKKTQSTLESRNKEKERRKLKRAANRTSIRYKDEEKPKPKKKTQSTLESRKKETEQRKLKRAANKAANENMKKPPRPPQPASNTTSLNVTPYNDKSLLKSPPPKPPHATPPPPVAAAESKPAATAVPDPQDAGTNPFATPQAIKGDSEGDDESFKTNLLVSITKSGRRYAKTNLGGTDIEMALLSEKQVNQLETAARNAQVDDSINRYARAMELNAERANRDAETANLHARTMSNLFQNQASPKRYTRELSVARQLFSPTGVPSDDEDDNEDDKENSNPQEQNERVE